jgi:hypothetical protein
MQEATSTTWCDKFVDVYTKYCDEAYALGLSDMDSNNIVNTIDTTLLLRATSYALVSSMQNARVNRLLRVLFDSGSDKTLIHQSALPPGITPSIGKKRRLTGVTSSVHVDKEVILENLTLPEFLAMLRVPGPIRAIVMYNDESPYDLIIGMDLMQVLGIDIHNTSKTIAWRDKRIPFKPRDYFANGLFQSTLLDVMDGSLIDPDETLLHSGYKSKTITSSHYERFSPTAIVEKQIHLTSSQRQDLASVLSKFPKLFSGQLQCYPGRKVHLELKPNAKPSSCRPYPVPVHQRDVFKAELDRLCDIGVLSRCGASTWLSPSFIIPKKDGSVRWISDFRELNKFITRRVYHLPKIQDILTRRSGYAFF